MLASLDTTPRVEHPLAEGLSAVPESSRGASALLASHVPKTVPYSWVRPPNDSASPLGFIINHNIDRTLTPPPRRLTLQAPQRGNRETTRHTLQTRVRTQDLQVTNWCIQTKYTISTPTARTAHSFTTDHGRRRAQHARHDACAGSITDRYYATLRPNFVDTRAHNYTIYIFGETS